MAAIVLWRRLAPEVISSEKIDEMVQYGYSLLAEQKKMDDGRQNIIGACCVWLDVWAHLKVWRSEEMKSIEEANRVFRGMQCLVNWCQDLEEELYNAGFADKLYFEKRITYCREFCALFPESDELLYLNMRRAEAEPYFSVGRVEG